MVFLECPLANATIPPCLVGVRMLQNLIYTVPSNVQSLDVSDIVDYGRHMRRCLWLTRRLHEYKRASLWCRYLLFIGRLIKSGLSMEKFLGTTFRGSVQLWL